VIGRTAEKIIEIENLVKKFGAKTTLAGVSFSVDKGKVYGLLGPNGAGKSTIIKILCGVYSATSGCCRVAGIDVSRELEKVRTKIGYMSQKFTLYQDLTVRENITFYADIYGLAAAKKRARVQELMELTELTDRTNSIVSVLSGGWKQRLALVCALLHSPPLLILDEPTAGVDPVSRKMFWTIIKELADKGLTILVTTHYMDEAEMCDEVSIIYEGTLIMEGEPKQLMQKMKARTLAEVFDKSVTECENEKERARKEACKASKRVARAYDKKGGVRDGN
jgi:ABC-2 type transport system ATP-binding protein